MLQLNDDLGHLTVYIGDIIGNKNQDGVIVTPDDDFLVSRGGAEAFNIYQRLLFDDTVAAAYFVSSNDNLEIYVPNRTIPFARLLIASYCRISYN